MERIYLSPPDMSDAERSALLAAFDSGWVAPVGPDLTAFEAEMCAFLGLEEGCAAALSSGTAALHLAMRLAGVGPGDEVWTSTMTFAATANAVTYQGAVPVFIDADPDTWQMDPAVLEAALKHAAHEGRLPAAVVPVDLYGQACDYDRILAACDAHEVPVIEDAAEGLGTTYRNRSAGTFGLAGVLSFNGNKLITTSGGGMLLSDDANLVARARHLATQAKEPALHYEHVETGYNYRLSNLLAALGRAQLARVPDLIARRRQIGERYKDALADIPSVSFMPEAEYGMVNHWLTCILLDPDVLDIDTSRPNVYDTTPTAVCTALGQGDIEARPLWKPMHRQPLFASKRLFTAAGCGVGEKGTAAIADELFARGMCLPSGSVMTDGQQDRVVTALRKVLGAPPLG